jgi:hypothetical protein
MEQQNNGLRESEKVQRMISFTQEEKGLFRKGYGEAHIVVPGSKGKPSGKYFVRQIDTYEFVRKAYLTKENPQPATLEQVMHHLIETGKSSGWSTIKLSYVIVQGTKYIYNLSPFECGVYTVDEKGTVIIWRDLTAETKVGESLDLEAISILFEYVRDTRDDAGIHWNQSDILDALGTLRNSKISDMYFDSNILIVQSYHTTDALGSGELKTIYNIQCYLRNTMGTYFQPNITIRSEDKAIVEIYKGILDKMSGFIDKWYYDNMIAIPKWKEFYLPVDRHGDIEIYKEAYEAAPEEVQEAMDAYVVQPIWWGISGRIEDYLYVLTPDSARKSMSSNSFNIELIQSFMRKHNDSIVNKIKVIPLKRYESLEELPWDFGS